MKPMSILRDLATAGAEVEFADLPRAEHTDTDRRMWQDGPHTCRACGASATTPACFLLGDPTGARWLDLCMECATEATEASLRRRGLT